MTTELELERTERGDTDVVRARGEIDLTNASAIHDAVAATARRVVVLDLSGVTFLDSAGIRALDAEIRALRDSNRALYVVAPAESRVGWTFRIAGFTSTVVVESLEAVPAPEDEA